MMEDNSLNKFDFYHSFFYIDAFISVFLMLCWQYFKIDMRNSKYQMGLHM